MNHNSKETKWISSSNCGLWFRTLQYSATELNLTSNAIFYTLLFFSERIGQVDNGVLPEQGLGPWGSIMPFCDLISIPFMILY